MTSTTSQGVPTARTSELKKWGAVALLTTVAILNIVDRFLPSVLAQPIKQDLMLSDTTLGLINGFGFLVVYAVIGIPIARLSDRGNYGLVISACATLWSVMTMLGGLTMAGWQLALTRMGVALGEAGSSPAAHAYISKNFAPDRRAAPLALLTISVPVANIIGLMGGGLLGETVGWRMTFVIMGVLGFLLAPIVYFTLRRRLPVADASPLPRQASLADAARVLRKRSYVLLLAGCAFIGVGGYSLGTFAPAFLMRVHGLTLGTVGVQYGLVAGSMGILSLVLMGWLADRLSRRDPRWLMWIISLMILAILPLTVSAFLVKTAWMAIVFIALSNVIATAYMVPVVAAIQRLTPPELRATASAVMLFCTAIMGGLGPFITGMISDGLHATRGPEALGIALLIVPATYAVAAVFYYLASHNFRADMVPDTPAAVTQITPDPSSRAIEDAS